MWLPNSIEVKSKILSKQEYICIRYINICIVLF